MVEVVTACADLRQTAVRQKLGGQTAGHRCRPCKSGTVPTSRKLWLRTQETSQPLFVCHQPCNMYSNTQSNAATQQHVLSRPCQNPCQQAAGRPLQTNAPAPRACSSTGAGGALREQSSWPHPAASAVRVQGEPRNRKYFDSVGEGCCWGKPGSPCSSPYPAIVH